MLQIPTGDVQTQLACEGRRAPVCDCVQTDRQADWQEESHD